MNAAPRTFDVKPAVREAVPLLIGLFGPSGSGKTFSALRLATGIQTITGGDIHVIDTESRRALHYADHFKFRHLQFQAPFGSRDYLAAIQQCVNAGAKVIVVDSMSHEHEGAGGYLSLHEAELDRLAKDDWKKRQAVNFLAWAKPAMERRALINGVLQLNANFVFCFRAKEKIKPVRGGEPIELGWMPIAGDEFLYEQTVNCLLLPGAGGVPTWDPVRVGERQMVKLPRQFDNVFQDGKPLDEETGGVLAQWAKGGSAAPAMKQEKPREFPETDTTELLAQYDAELASAARDGMPALEAAWLRIPKDLRKALKSALDRRHKPDAEVADKARASVDDATAEFA